jgi:hypothetical protein
MRSRSRSVGVLLVEALKVIVEFGVSSFDELGQGRPSDAGVGEGSRRVQPHCTRLQSPARSQYHGVPRLDCRSPGLKSMLEAVLPLKSTTFGTLRLATGLSQT